MTLFVTCGKCREELCALRSGDQPAAESTAVEKHLAGCVDCQRYEAELRKMTVRLAAWDESLPEIAPTGVLEQGERFVVQRHQTQRGLLSLPS